MTKAQEILEYIHQVGFTYPRVTAYQVLVSPKPQFVTIHFMDTSSINAQLPLSPMELSHKDFFELVDPSEKTKITFQQALEKGDTFGIYIAPHTVSRLLRRGSPEPRQRVHHTNNRTYASQKIWKRAQTMNSRV